MHEIDKIPKSMMSLVDVGLLVQEGRTVVFVQGGWIVVSRTIAGYHMVERVDTRRLVDGRILGFEHMSIMEATLMLSFCRLAEKFFRDEVKKGR